MHQQGSGAAKTRSLAPISISNDTSNLGPHSWSVGTMEALKLILGSLKDAPSLPWL